MSDEVSVKIGHDLIAPIVQAKIQAALLSELGGDTTKLVEGLVAASLSVRVNNEGRVDQYGSNNKFTVLEYLVNSTIKAAAREALHEWVAENRPRIQEALKKQLEKRPTQLAKAMVDGLANNLSSQWCFNVAVTLTQPRS